MDQLAANVTMTNANTYYDGPTLTLAAGTWLLIASLHIAASGTGTMTAKLWDGTTVVASQSATISNAWVGHLNLSGIVVLARSTIYKASAACQTAGAVITAAATYNGAGNNASTLVAVKIA